MKALFTEAQRQALRETSESYGIYVTSVRTVRSSSLNAPEPHGRPAVILVMAAKGHARAARALVGKAIKKALKITKWRTDPYYVVYRSAREMKHTGGWEDRGQYELNVTDAEMKRVSDEIGRMAKAGGWDQPPVDIYHD